MKPKQLDSMWISWQNHRRTSELCKYFGLQLWILKTPFNGIVRYPTIIIMRHLNCINQCLPIVLFLLLISCPVFAQTITGVSGTVSNGNSIVVSGYNFGSGPNVLLFDDFEGGTNGNPLSTKLAPLGTWTYVNSAAWTSYSFSNKVSGNLAARFDSYNYPPNNHPVIWVDAPVPFNTFYVSWWGLIPAGDRIPGCDGYGGCNWKTVWIAPNTGYVNDADVTIVSNGITTYEIFGNDYPYEYSPYLSGTNIEAGAWHRFQFYVKGSTNPAVGQERIWLTLPSGTSLAKSRNRQTLNSGDENKRQSFYVNGYVRDTPDSHPTFDDVYIAYGENAQARVEIGNADTYPRCSRLTMCTPTSWEASSIVCTVRRGNLAPGTTWIYVTDAEGNKSSGYPISTDFGTAVRSLLLLSK